MSIGLFHSHYSFKSRSILTLEESGDELNENRPVSVFDICKFNNIKDLYLNDFSFSGFIDAYKFCDKNNINLKFGFKVICCGDINDKSDKSFETEHRITIWLTKSAGYQNFVKIISRAQVEGFYYIPRIDCNTLKELWHDGLGLSVGMYDSFIHKNTLSFGRCIPDFPINPIFFIEQNNLPFDDILRRKTLEYAERENCEVIESKSIYYHKYEDFEQYMVFRCVEEGSSLDKPELRGMSSDSFCFEDFKNNYKEHKLTNFEKSFEKYNLPFHGIRLPSVEIDPKIKEKFGAAPDASNYQLLTALCKKGYEARIANKTIDIDETEWYRNQCSKELKVLKTVGFVDYMLIVWDVINFCRENKIPIGRGRGSAASSSVAYLTGITDIPVKKHGLIFERFLSAERAATKVVDGITYLTDCADIDMDISQEQRYKVIDYLNSKYPGKTSKILSISTLQGKVLIKDVAKIVDNCQESELGHISSLINIAYGNVEDIEDTYKRDNEFKEWCDDHPNTYRIALKLRNLARNKSVHASGYLVTHCNTNEIIPVEISTNKKTGEKSITSSLDMYSACEIACKLDTLGLKVLDIIDNTAQLVGIDFNFIDINDESIYKYLRNNEAPFTGLFQTETGTLGERTLRQIQARNIDHLSASVALGRPGTLSFISDYVNYVKTGELSKIHPEIDKWLGEDANIIIYQESLMRVLREAFKMEWPDVHAISKVIRKKLRDKMPVWEPKIYEAGRKAGLPDNAIKKVWDCTLASADYQFCKAHAFCYSYLAATCTYLKTNYTKEFFLSLLKYPPGGGDKKENHVINIKRELDLFGIKLLPPSLIKGNQDFIIENNKDIRFGLEGVKGLAETTLKKLDDFKPNNCNKFEFFQASRQAELSCGVMSSLIMSGAADEFVTDTRSKLSFECLLFSKLKDKEKLFCIQNGNKYDYDLIEMIKWILDWTDSLGKKVARSTRLNTLRKNSAKYCEIYKNNRENEDLTNLIYERQNLGFNYSSTLKEIFSKNGRDDIINLAEFRNVLEPNQTAVIICHVKEVVCYTSKKGNPTMKLFIEDESDSRYFYFGGRAYQEYISEHNGKTDIKENDIVAIKIQKSKDGSGGFIQKISIQGVKIFTKMADIKDSFSEEEKLEIAPPTDPQIQLKFQ